MKYLPLVAGGLFRKKTRTVLNLLSVIVAFLLFGLLESVSIAFEAGAESADAKRLLTTARYSIIEPLPLAYLRRIEQVPGVVGVAHADWFGAKYQNESNAFPVFAVDPRRYLDMYPEFTIAPEQREAFIRTRTGAVAGARLVERFGWRLGQKLPLSSEIHPKADGSLDWEFDLVGVLDADDPVVRGNTDMVLINVAYFDEARQVGKGRTGWYIVRVGEAADARLAAAAIDRMFQNSPDETKTQPEKEFAIGFAKQIGDIGALVTRILAAVFFTILLLTGNTVAQSIRERIPELAILKTLGFSDGKVTGLVLAEAVVLLLLGAGVGMAAATTAVPVLNGATGGRFPPLIIDGHTWLWALAIALGLALVIGLPPALRAWRLSIVDALAGHR
ncbi:MAG: FtsX-like permease family protein [Candidatus Rokubacteria bacterium]|nr:FtsX-like permease family protein [Candidatus Rokubacteria bacterium]